MERSVNRPGLRARARTGAMKGLSLRTKVFFLFAGAALLIVVPALLLIANVVEKRAYARATEDLDDAASSLQLNWSIRGDNLAQAAQYRAARTEVADAWSRGRTRTLYGLLHEGLDKEVVLA